MLEVAFLVVAMAMVLVCLVGVVVMMYQLWRDAASSTMPPRTWAERMERETTGEAPVRLGPATRAPRTYREMRALSDEELWDLASKAENP